MALHYLLRFLVHLSFPLYNGETHKHTLMQMPQNRNAQIGIDLKNSGELNPDLNDLRIFCEG